MNKEGCASVQGWGLCMCFPGEVHSHSHARWRTRALFLVCARWRSLTLPGVDRGGFGWCPTHTHTHTHTHISHLRQSSAPTHDIETIRLATNAGRSPAAKLLRRLLKQTGNMASAADGASNKEPRPGELVRGHYAACKRQNGPIAARHGLASVRAGA